MNKEGKSLEQRIKEDREVNDLVNHKLSFEEELEVSRRLNREYLESIDSVELAKTKEMFSKIVLEPVDFFKDVEDYYTDIDDSNDVSEDII